MQYRCLEDFRVDRVDDNGFTIENEFFIVEKGTVWNTPEDENFRLTGGEIRLENDDLEWIEITKKYLKRYFVEIREKYKTVCSECGYKFLASKSLGQEMGYIDMGCGRCPKCKKFLNLTFDPTKNEMITKSWDKV